MKGIATAVLLLLSAPSWADDVEIAMRDKQFAPQQIIVERGTVIRFVNRDAISHNVVSHEAGLPFDLQLQKPGEVREMAFTKPGRYAVGCDLHPRMSLEVTVK
jgi:plastocyanin